MKKPGKTTTLVIGLTAAVASAGLEKVENHQLNATNEQLEQELYEERELLQAFSRFGQDISEGQWYLNGRGQYFCEFDYVAHDSTRQVGRWERVIEDRYGNIPGEISINGLTYAFDDSGRVTGPSANTGDGYEIYALERSVRVWISDQPTELLFTARDSLWNVSGEMRFRLNPCGEFEAICDSLMLPPEFDDFTLYFARIERADSLGTFNRFMQVNIESDVRSMLTGRQGTYKLWFCMVDRKGMPGHFIGPIEVMAGELCPE